LGQGIAPRITVDLLHRFPANCLRTLATADEIRSSFARQAFMKTLGASLELVERGRVHIGVPFSPGLTQQHGYAHAGVISSIADSACGYAAMTLAPDGAEVLTVEFKISLIAPARGERFIARAAVLRAGKRLSFCSGEVHTVTNSREELIATMLSTIITKTI
jgi:uncharacterized protein (TIGR00369 family)